MLEGDAPKGDGGFTIRVEGIDAEEFGFGLVDGESEDEALQTLSGMADDSHIVRIKEDLEKKVNLK